MVAPGRMDVLFLMGRKDDEPFLGKGKDLLPQDGGGPRVERGSDLVQENDGVVSVKGAGEGHAGLLSCGKGGSQGIRDLPEAHRVHEAERPLKVAVAVEGKYIVDDV